MSKIKKEIRNRWQLYILLIPSLIYVIIFNYTPMVGVILAFKNYDPVLGITGSPWVGLEKFQMFFNSYYFTAILKNTLGISLYALLVNTPLPIILALLINEVPNKRFKKFVQTVSYAPYFISLVVLVGMFNLFLASETGIINQLLINLGLGNTNFVQDPSWFKTIYVFTGLWQGIGWWSIIYVGALSNVDPALHEAAVIDGASRIKRIIHINLPAIQKIAVVLFIMAMGSLMSVGFEKVFLMQNPSNLEASEIIATYAYNVAFITAKDYSFSTAVGLFNSVINIILLFGANFVVRLFGEDALF